MTERVAEAVPAPQIPEVIAPEVAEDEELAPLSASREFVIPPAAAISQGEGNDILSTFSLDTNLIRIPGEDGEFNNEPLIKKSVGLEGVEELVDMTAMVDIVFFLLIFFMMTSLQIVLASMETPTPDPEKQDRGKVVGPGVESDAVVVRIERDGSISLDGEKLEGRERELRSRLGSLFAGGGSSKKLSVLGHGDAQHGTLVMVLDAAQDTGIKDISVKIVDEEE